MGKRFLQVCKNPICGKEFGILHDKAGEIKIHCPHCKKLQKIIFPVSKKRKDNKL
jgi:phage FluMu protein Com